MSIGPGAFVEALEYAAETRATIVGKPTKSFFDLALQDLGIPSDHVGMIGDDARDDIEGAMEAGIQGFLVQTGKYSKGDENKLRNLPTLMKSNFSEIIHSLDFDVA